MVAFVPDFSRVPSWFAEFGEGRFTGGVGVEGQIIL
jgi:hypothetical protein